jgi:hypothetical protein
MTLDDSHLTYLTDHAVSLETIERTGIYSEGSEIVFPWRDGETVTHQRRPWPGEGGQYFWESGKDLHFWDLRDAGPDSPYLVVEGTKQSLATVSHADPRWSVLGMAGCEGWSKCDLSRFTGRDVWIGLDADAGENLSVWEAGDLFRQELEFYEVRSVRFLHLPARGTQGLDDVLAKRPDAIRTRFLEHLAEKAATKPAERKPSTRKGARMATVLPDTGGRPGVAVNLDRLDVMDKITGHLLESHDGRTLFNFGDVITRISGHETRPLDRDSFNALVAETMACFHYTEATGSKPAVFVPTWPDASTVGAVMSRAERFSELRRVVRVPFLRPDGTVCYTQGYDRQTGTVLVSDGLDDVSVPEEPTQEETRTAAKFLTEEWLGDLPFKTPADRANALAMALTPFMRGVVPLSPLGVVSGLQMGVGKNLLADCIAILATGRPADPLPYVQDDDEMRKMITSAFQSGAELFVFDEAHEVQGAQLARAITSLTYADRILGVTRIAKYPNTITWMSLGNQVKVNGDLARRVFFVYLHPTGRNVIDREASAFRHPDLKLWTQENRGSLVSAALTVLRGWYAAGRPEHSRGATMGSFEPWDRILSGVLAYAGLPEFLTDVKARRSESDFSTSYWDAHLHWLAAVFGSQPFVAGAVKEEALRAPRSAELPPGLEDPSDKGWTRALGRAYASRVDRDHSGVRLIKIGRGHGSTIKWGIVTDSDTGGETGTEDGGSGGEGGSALSLRVGETPPSQDARTRAHARTRERSGETTPITSITPKPEARPVVPGTLLGFDLETASAADMFTGKHEGPFVRLCGAVSHTTGDTEVGTDPTALIDSLNSAEVLYGHNVLWYDLVALAYHHGADYDSLAAKTVDTLPLSRFLDPPGARGMKPWGQRGYYGLDQTAARLGVAGKTDDLMALADRHGGLDKIPVDDPDYRAYLVGDLTSQRAVFGGLTGGREWPEAQLRYAQREMRVGALQGRMTLNGWAVDLPLLRQRVKGEEDRVAGARAKLAEYGVPLNKPDRYRLKLKADWPETFAGRSAAELRAVLQEQDPEELVRAGVAVKIPGDAYESPWSTVPGREAIVAAFRDAGAEHYPKTRTGALALSSEALGDGHWVDHTGTRRPGMLRAYGHLPGVRSLCLTLELATGATAKYAEILRHVGPDGRVHPVTSAPQASGRWATTGPASSNLHPDHRSVFVPDEGHVHLTCDLAQVDVRAVAGHCQDPALIAMLQPGQDYHSEMARIFFGDPSRRKDGKPISHSMNYNQSARACAERNGLPEAFVTEAFRRQAEAMPDLVEWKRAVADLASTGALLDNGFGRLMRPDPERGYTQGPALMGQGAARDIMCESLLRLVGARPDVTPYLRGVVHDEVILSVPAGEAEEWAEELHKAFTWEWKGVPILCSVSNPGARWSECDH